jgi:CubicO group peptidase (beta-lactamase class C family)
LKLFQTNRNEAFRAAIRKIGLKEIASIAELLCFPVKIIVHFVPFIAAAVLNIEKRIHCPASSEVIHSHRRKLAWVLFVLTALGIAGLSYRLVPRSLYRYSVPPQVNDGWDTASLEAENVNPVFIWNLMDRIQSKSYRNIHSVLLVKNGKLVLDEYFPGRDSNGRFWAFNRGTRHEMHSVTKSVNSILVGIAIDRHLIGGVNEKVSSLFPEYTDVFADHIRDAIRLKDLLTMSAGLSWDEWSYPYGDPRNDLEIMDQSKDRIRYVLTRPVVAPPGAKFAYSGGMSYLLAEIVRRHSGMRTDKFAAKYLFGPLGITNYFWWKYPDGAVDAGGGLVLRPRDMAKIGSLLLNGGRWQGKQIVSEQWVTDSIKNYVDARQFHPWIQGDGYGYQWWTRTFNVNGRKFFSYHAAGRGGQFIFVFPSLQMVAVFTGWNDNALGTQPFDMVERYILPAVALPVSDRQL